MTASTAFDSELLTDAEEEVDPSDAGPGECCSAEGDPGADPGFGSGVGVAR